MTTPAIVWFLVLYGPSGSAVTTIPYQFELATACAEAGELATKETALNYVCVPAATGH